MANLWEGGSKGLFPFGLRSETLLLLNSSTKAKRIRTCVCSIPTGILQDSAYGGERSRTCGTSTERGATCFGHRLRDHYNSLSSFPVHTVQWVFCPYYALFDVRLDMCFVAARTVHHTRIVQDQARKAANLTHPVS